MFLNRNILLLSPTNWSHLVSKSSSLAVRTSSVCRIQNSFVYTQQKRPRDETRPLLLVRPLANLKESVRTIVLGGPGYTKFGHGRFKAKLSKFAYFWYTFLVGSLAFVVFFDFESFMFSVDEPDKKMGDAVTAYSLSIKPPKAKGLSNVDDVSNVRADDEEDKSRLAKKLNDDDENEDDDSVEKKAKANSFRQRKVNYNRMW